MRRLTPLLLVVLINVADQSGSLWSGATAQDGPTLRTPADWDVCERS
jgi:hypothetical protein